MADFEIVLPNLGFGMEEGRLLAWLKQPGDSVRKGEAIAEVESDKANCRTRSARRWRAGCHPGSGGAGCPGRDGAGAHSQLAHRCRLSCARSAPTAAPAERRIARRSLPVAQRLASEHGIDLAAVKGTGTDGRITREDVQAVIDSRADQRASSGQGPDRSGSPQTGARQRHRPDDRSRATGNEGRIRREDVEALLNAPTTRSLSRQPSAMTPRHRPPRNRRSAPCARPSPATLAQTCRKRRIFTPPPNSISRER